KTEKRRTDGKNDKKGEMRSFQSLHWIHTCTSDQSNHILTYSRVWQQRAQNMQVTFFKLNSYNELHLVAHHLTCTHTHTHTHTHAHTLTLNTHIHTHTWPTHTFTLTLNTHTHTHTWPTHTFTLTHTHTMC